MKLRKTIQSGHHSAQVYADADWNEYRVKYFKDSKYLGEQCDSFADSEEDAIDTANAELKFMSSKEAANV